MSDLQAFCLIVTIVVFGCLCYTAGRFFEKAVWDDKVAEVQQQADENERLLKLALDYQCGQHSMYEMLRWYDSSVVVICPR